MATSFGALCTDFYINHKLVLKMDLPSERETVLHFLDAVKRDMPDMARFRRFDGELSLESARQDSEYRWLAMRRTSVRSGQVNPDTMEEGYRFHRRVLELAPFHLTISALDVDYMELLFGFDLECKQNHDEIVFEALCGRGELGSLMNGFDGKVLDFQPSFGVNLTDDGSRQAYFEVKTRSKTRRGRAHRYRQEPISIFLTIRQYGPLNELGDMQPLFNDMARQADFLCTDKLVPDLLTPIARQITHSSIE